MACPLLLQRYMVWPLQSYPQERISVCPDALPEMEEALRRALRQWEKRSLTRVKVVGNSDRTTVGIQSRENHAQPSYSHRT